MKTFALFLTLVTATVWAAEIPFVPAAMMATTTTVYRGVIDEQGTDFFLTKADDFSPIAVLYSPNFDKQIFSRFVGHPVIVKGILVTTKDGRKMIQVQSIDDIQRMPEPIPGQ